MWNFIIFMNPDKREKDCFMYQRKYYEEGIFKLNQHGTYINMKHLFI